MRIESLTTQVDQLQDQRDQLLKKLGRVSQEHQAQLAAVDNLTMVLEGFQREKENDLKLAQKDFNDRMAREEARRGDYQEEIKALNEKLEMAGQGLEAAARLNEQLEAKAKVIASLRQEVKARDELLKKAQGELNTASASGAGKVDRGLVKNLVVGYVAADAAKKKEVLKVVATVLDFNQEERLKTGLDGASSASWLRGMFAPSPGQSRDRIQTATGLDKSLAQAFIHFLEEESTPSSAAASAAASTPPRLPAADLAEESARRMQVRKLIFALIFFTGFHTPMLIFFLESSRPPIWLILRVELEPNDADGTDPACRRWQVSLPCSRSNCRLNGGDNGQPEQ